MPAYNQYGPVDSNELVYTNAPLDRWSPTVLIAPIKNQD